MAWSDENVTELSDDFFIYEYYWEIGKHKDRKGKIHNINEMSEKHLRNTIKYFKGLSDTSILENQLIGKDN